MSCWRSFPSEPRRAWQHPRDTTRDTGPFGTHPFNIGGNPITRGGLVFIGATADNYLRAIDENTGEAVGKTRLPAGGQATPMSYAVMAMADWTPPAATT
jgi:quinoprotein glucose dehydrogenase